MKIALALGMMLAINVFLFLGQVGVEQIAQEMGIPAGTTLYKYDGSMLQAQDTGNYNLTVATDLELPDSGTSINPDNNNWFVDAIGSLKSWFTKVGKGLTYFDNLVNAVPNFLKSIGLPNEVSFALGFFWKALILFLVVMLVWGRTL